eukprot:Filipodium_phascolosomae@DN341_c0_g1_i1.p3
MAKVSLGDRNFIPLKCCKSAFPNDLNRLLLEGKDYVKYKEMEYEMDHPAVPKPSATDIDARSRQLMAAQGYKACPKCTTPVERRHGCVHMTCLSCRYEFCMTCLKVWRTCTCQLHID